MEYETVNLINKLGLIWLFPSKKITSDHETGKIFLDLFFLIFVLIRTLGQFKVLLGVK